MKSTIIVDNTIMTRMHKDDVIDNQGLAYLTDEHIDKFYNAFKEYKDIAHYAKVASTEEILSHDGNMNINWVD